jgi:hypothetical protein
VNEYVRMFGSYSKGNTVSTSFEVTPEPTTLALLVIGTAGL